MQAEKKTTLWMTIILALVAGLVAGLVSWQSGAERTVDYVRNIATVVAVVMTLRLLWVRRRPATD
jgi:FtsH-binding integral membrane protein